MRPFTHDGDEDLPFDEDDEWDLEYGDDEEGERGADELPDDDWQAGSMMGGPMRVRILGWGLALLAVCVAADWARAEEAGTPSAVNPGSSKASPADRLEQRFKVLDANGNGGIEVSEFTAGRNKAAAKKRAEAAFQRLDTDKNGVVSKEEFVGRATGKTVPPPPAKAEPAAPAKAAPTPAAKD